jgi:hypothetical protein
MPRSAAGGVGEEGDGAPARMGSSERRVKIAAGEMGLERATDDDG